MDLKLMAMAGTLAALTASGAVAAPAVVNVWPAQKMPGWAPTGEEHDTTTERDGRIAGRRVARLTDVSQPTLTLYRPPKEKDTGAAVVIAPGGGYQILAFDLEGTEVAEWLNSLGVTGIVLKYRVPRPPNEPRGEQPVGPLQDAQRAISLVRSRASEWGIDPHRVGLLGFSAGGHLAAETATNSDRRSYPPIDEVDQESCRPDFAVLIYPAYLVGHGDNDLAPEIGVDQHTPPTFLAQAGDDPVNVENVTRMYAALHRAHVPAELHVYPKGGHGYGLRRTELPVTSWPDRCAEWLRTLGVLDRPR